MTANYKRIADADAVLRATEAHWNDDPALDWVRDMFEVRPSRKAGS